MLTPKLFDEWHFVNEAVRFPVAFLENAKLVLIEKIFVTVPSKKCLPIAEYLCSGINRALLYQKQSILVFIVAFSNSYL